MASSSKEPTSRLHSTPKFSFKAALIHQKKKGQPNDEKPLTAVAVTTSPTRKTKLLETPGTSSLSSQNESRIVKPSHIPSLGARTRLNSTNSALPSLPSTSSLGSSSWPSPASEIGRPASSLGKRGVYESSSSLPSQSTPSVSDFGQLPRPRTNSAQSSSIRPPKAKQLSRLPGPPSTRGQWSGLAQSARASASPSVGRAASSKIARSDSTNDVHSPSVAPLPAHPPLPSTLARSDSLTRTSKSTSSSGSVPKARGKIGMLPQLKSRPSVMVRTILDQKESTSSGDDDDDSDDSDDLQGPDVSGIKTRNKTDIIRRDTTQELNERHDVSIAVAGAMQPPQAKNATRSGKPRTGQRRSSGMSSASRSDADLREKENDASGMGPQGQTPAFVVGTVDRSGGVPHRVRSSLPLAVAKPGPQPKASVSAAMTNSPPDEKFVLPISDKVTEPTSAKAEVGTASPMTRTSSLTALRLRGLQPNTPSAGAATRPAKPDVGIKASILHANPVHPSIAALQSKLTHQPISTPEALVKAKKRLSGALSTTSASPMEQEMSASRSSSRLDPGKLNTPQKFSKPGYATLPRTTSRSRAKPALRLPNPTSKGTEPERCNRKVSPSKKAPSVPTAKTSPSKNPDVDAREPGISAAEIDASLMASLRVVAKKANLNVKELLQGSSQATKPEGKDDSSQSETNSSPSESPRTDKATLSPAKVSPSKLNPSRFDRAASEDLDSFAGDVSVDLMALNLASPASDTSMLRSPLVAEATALDTPPSVPAVVLPPASTPQPSAEDQDQRQGAADAATAVSPPEGDEEGERGESSCGSPSLRAAASRIPKHTQPPPPVATPVQRPFVSSSTPAALPPPSVGMSAKTRSKLRKAIRESIALEAHFFPSSSSMRQSLLLSSSESKANLASVGSATDATKDAQAVEGGGMTKSISGILLTEDDRYLDELVDAVAKIGFGDEGRRDSAEGGEDDDLKEDHRPFEARDERHGNVDEVDALRSQLSLLRDQLSEVQYAYEVQHTQLSELQLDSDTQRTRAAEREIELSKQIASTTRANRMAHWLQSHTAQLSGQVASIEHDKAATAWSTVKTNAMAELEDIKTQNDSLLFFRHQLDMLQRLAVAQRVVA